MLEKEGAGLGAPSFFARHGPTGIAAGGSGVKPKRPRFQITLALGSRSPLKRVAMPAENPVRPIPESAESCPCGSGRAFGACCGPILGRLKEAADAEELMRARFTAHCTGNYPFLHATYVGTTGRPYVAEEGTPAESWTRLVVHEHAPGRTTDSAYVDFSAYYTQEGHEGVLHEKAEFIRREGRWIYSRAVRLGPAPLRSAHPKVGRNDPCPCGSGKKYKRCCLVE
jgi:SEC-C motif domain protein